LTNLQGGPKNITRFEGKNFFAPPSVLEKFPLEDKVKFLPSRVNAFETLHKTSKKKKTTKITTFQFANPPNSNLKTQQNPSKPELSKNKTQQSKTRKILTSTRHIKNFRQCNKNHAINSQTKTQGEALSNFRRPETSQISSGRTRGNLAGIATNRGKWPIRKKPKVKTICSRAVTKKFVVKANL
jgi:hypothetical protein